MLPKSKLINSFINQSVCAEALIQNQFTTTSFEFFSLLNVEWKDFVTFFFTTCGTKMFDYYIKYNYYYYIQFKSSNMLKIHHIKHLRR